MAQRRATMRDIDTGETRKVLRGTEEYEQLKQEGWLSNEQVSHRKEYQEDYQPDYIDEPEDTYTDVDEKELLMDRVSVMYDIVIGRVDDIPEARYFHKSRTFVDFSEQKQMLYNAIDDFYNELDNTLSFDNYIDSNMSSINDLIEIIKHDSDQDTVYMAFTQLLNVLQGGSMSETMSKLLGNLDDYQGSYQGWYEKSSRYSDTFSRTI